MKLPAPRGRLAVAITLLCVAALLWTIRLRAQNVQLGSVKLPAGFEIRIYARVPQARQMALSPDGTLFVGTRDEGKVFAVKDGSGGPGAIVEIAKGCYKFTRAQKELLATANLANGVESIIGMLPI